MSRWCLIVERRARQHLGVRIHVKGQMKSSPYVRYGATSYYLQKMPSQGPRAGGEKVPPFHPPHCVVLQGGAQASWRHKSSQQTDLARAPQLGRCNFQAARNSIYWQKGPKLSQPSRPSGRYKQRAHDRSVRLPLRHIASFNSLLPSAGLD